MRGVVERRQVQLVGLRLVLSVARRCRVWLLRSPGRLVVRPDDAARATAVAPKLSKEGISLRDMLDRLESDMISQALEQTGGNKNRAAQLLGLNRTTLVEKLKKMQIVRDS